MEAKELRIGNYFIYNTDGCFPNNPERESKIISVVRQIKEDSVGITHLETTGIMIGGLELIKPIPLTEEWLMDFGFIKECDWKISIGEGAFIWIDENDFTAAIGTPYEASGNQRTIKYVNELQNLHYALTKQELTIKK